MCTFGAAATATGWVGATRPRPKPFRINHFRHKSGRPAQALTSEPAGDGPATNRGTPVSMPLCTHIKSLHFVATPLFCCVRNQYTIDSGVDLMSSEAERTQTNRKCVNFDTLFARSVDFVYILTHFLLIASILCAFLHNFRSPKKTKRAHGNKQTLRACRNPLI